jgi:phospholipid/cholesterol/gamma-HCH transport system substrate-binding protein
MNDQKLRFRIGLFVLGALILLGGLMVLFGRSPTWFKRQNRYTVLFADAGGLAPGTPVRRSGFRIGEVEDLALDEETGAVRVTLALDKEHVLRSQDQPTLVRGILGGDTSIDLVPRRGCPPPVDASPVAPGSVLQGVNQADVATVLNQTSALAPDTHQTLQDFRQSLQRIDSLAGEMEKAMRDMVPELRRTNDEIRALAKATRETIPELRRTNDQMQLTARHWGNLGERLDGFLQTNHDKLTQALDRFTETLDRFGKVFSDDNQRSLSATFTSVRNGTEHLDSLTRNTDELVTESRQTIKRVNDSVTRADDVLANLQRATQPWAEHSGVVMKNLDESSVKLNRTLGDVRDLLRIIAQEDGTLHRICADPALYNNLNDAATMLAHILPRLDRTLHDLEIFSDKIARHPEVLGVRGAMAPSSGLKEAPPVSPSWQQPPGQ